MSDQPAEPVPDTAAMPPDPQPPHEGPLGHLEDWLHSHGHAVETGLKDAALITKAAAPLVHGHAGQVLALVARILANPEFRALAPEAVQIAAGALQLAEAAL